MRLRLLAAVVLLVALQGILPAGAVDGAEPPATETVVPCSECGMSAKVSGRFTARIVRATETMYFCDIGDLAAYLERTHLQDYAAAVHDFTSGEWVDAGRAFFVIDKQTYRTPMGWGVAAFQERAAVAGATLDFEALRKALR